MAKDVDGKLLGYVCDPCFEEIDEEGEDGATA